MDNKTKERMTLLMYEIEQKLEALRVQWKEMLEKFDARTK